MIIRFGGPKSIGDGNHQLRLHLLLLRQEYDQQGQVIMIVRVKVVKQVADMILQQQKIIMMKLYMHSHRVGHGFRVVNIY